MTCFAAKHSKFEVGGCCQLDLFSLKKIFFARIFRPLLRIISGGQSATMLHAKELEQAPAVWVFGSRVPLLRNDLTYFMPTLLEFPAISWKEDKSPTIT